MKKRNLDGETKDNFYLIFAKSITHFWGYYQNECLSV